MTYAAGESVALYLDVLPAAVVPLPPGVPTGLKLRAVVTERMLSVLWQGAADIGRVDVDMTPEQTAGVALQPWQVGDYTITVAGGCGCGVSRLQRFSVFPEVTLLNLRRASRPAEIYGVPPQRWDRV